MNNTLEELLQKLSEDAAYQNAVFHARSVYFIVHNGEILEISDDASCGPKGGWFPDIYKGLSPEKNAFIEECMEKFDIDECFFEEPLQHFDAEDIDYIVEWFEDEEDDDSLEVLKYLQNAVEQGEAPFNTMEAVIKAFSRTGLDPSLLYYEWEGSHIEFYDNIAWTGEERGVFERMSDEEWLDILSNIDNYIVNPRED